MKDRLKVFLEKWFCGFPLYQIAVGGYRYYRANRENAYKPQEFLHHGNRVRIEAGVSIAAPERLYLGDNVGIGQRCIINAVGGCHIGKCCQIAQEAIILTTEHQYTGGETLPYDMIRLVKPVYLEDYVWIGARVSIVPGVRIGEGAIVAMGSVVTQDVPSLAIVAGNPANVVMYRHKDQFDRLKGSDAIVDPFDQLRILKVPPITKRKFKAEIGELGFDVSCGQDHFYYDKRRKLGERLIGISGTGESQWRT